MVAYGAVVSLMQILDTILHPGWQRTSHNITQLGTLHEKVSFLLDFLENTSYGKCKESALEILETKIRDAAYKAEDVIESHIANQLLGEPETTSFGESSGVSDRVFTDYLVIFILIRKLIHVGIQKMIVLWIQIFIRVMHVTPISVQSLVPVNFQNVIFVAAQILIPFIVHLFVPVILLSAILAVVIDMIHAAVLKGIAFAARYRRYDSQPEDEDLRLVIDDLSFITKEVIKIKDVCGAGQELENRNVLPEAALSGRDSGGVGKNVVVGFESDLEEIKARLIEDSSMLGIVSIVGMGGIGKTTLARQVHDDPYIVYHFDIRAWVAVSQEYSLRHVLLGLLDSAELLTEEMQEKTDERLAEYLFQNLMGRRYLIVMDDMWDTEIWDAVRRSCPDDYNGSRVLLTTRLSNVALYANSCSPFHQMRFLNDDESWNLLREKVFGDKDCPPELKDTGKEIARNCGGLPLAIVVIGGLLYRDTRTQENWRNVAENLNSMVSKDDEQCLDILDLSYNHLPRRLKPCFLYMGAFPEDCEIPVSKLISLWAAEGFLKPSRSKSLEEVAEEYLKDLIERSLILVCKRSSNGKIKTCNIHDLLRELCLQNAQKENFLHAVNWDGDVTLEGAEIRWRRLSIHPNALYANTSDDLISSYSLARSFLCSGKHLTYPSHVHLGFRLLRVLDIVVVHFLEFPYEIIKLVHLRYLGFSYSGSIPPSISELWNLQTIVHHNWILGSKYPLLPMEIWSMPYLRHLYVMPTGLFDPLGDQFLGNYSVLENLLTLVDIRNFRCTKDILKRIPNLKKLGISYNVSSSVDWSEYQLESLVNLHHLETLKILIRHPYLSSNVVYPPKLAFPQELKKLTLSGCGIPWESMTIIGALPNLEVLKLKRNACHGLEWEPVEGEFCRLMFLLLEETDLMHWRTNETHFPSLQRLIIRSCYKLKEIPSDIGEIPTLQMIELVDCHRSAVSSAKQIQEEQESLGNEDLKVHIDQKRRFKDRFNSRILR